MLAKMNISIKRKVIVKMDKEKYIKVTKPQEGCPSGRVLSVINIQDDGTIIGMNADNENDWTRYYIPSDAYEFIVGEIEKEKYPEGVIVGESYNFLFEGKNNEYDEEYKDYIAGEANEDFQRLLAKERNAIQWLVKRLERVETENRKLKDIITDAVSIGEAQGEDFHLEPWNSLKDAMDSYAKKNKLESYDGADLGNDF